MCEKQHILKNDTHYHADVIRSNFSRLSGRALCPAALGGARRPPVPKALVKNQFAADSSSEASSCGDNEGISRCQIFTAIWWYPVPGDAGRCPASGGDSSGNFLGSAVFVIEANALS